MKKLSIFLLALFLSTNAFAAYREVFNPHTGKLDKVGVSEVSKDVTTTDCSNGQILKYNGAIWACASDQTGAAGSTFTVKEDDASKDTSTSVLDFGTGMDATSNPAGEINVSLDASELTSDAQVFYNNGGAFGGDAQFTFDDVNDVVSIGHATTANTNTPLVVSRRGGSNNMIYAMNMRRDVTDITDGGGIGILGSSQTFNLGAIQFGSTNVAGQDGRVRILPTNNGGLVSGLFSIDENGVQIMGNGDPSAPLELGHSAGLTPIVIEGTADDGFETTLAFGEPAVSDKQITFFNATDTVLGRDTTDTLTNKTLSASNNVIEADSLKDADHGEFTCASASCTIDNDVVSNDEVAPQAVSTDQIQASNKPTDGMLLTYNGASLKAQWKTCTEVTGAAGLCDGNDASGGGGGTQVIEDYLIDVTANGGVSFDSTEVSKDTTWSNGTLGAYKNIYHLGGGAQAMTVRGTGFDFSGSVTVSSDLTITGDNIEATTETDRFVFMANGSTYAPEAIDLGTDTAGNYAASNSEGGDATGIAANTVVAADIANGDHGDFTYSSNVAALDANVVSADEIAVQSVTPSDLEASDTLANLEIPTYNSTSGKFQWKTCAEITGAAGLCDGSDDGGAGGGDNITVNGAAATDANFAEGSGIDINLNTGATPDDVTITQKFVWRPEVQSAKLPLLNPAQIDAGESNFRLLFDASTPERVSLDTVIAPYQGGPLAIDFFYSMASATTNRIAFAAFVECITSGDSVDTNAGSYDGINSAWQAVPGTAGHMNKLTMTLGPSTIDSCAENDRFRLMVSRDTASADDTATGDLELLEMRVYEV